MERTFHVVILGGGFAGLAAAKNLAGRPNVKVTLLDRKNHHVFQPLLYQVALAQLSPAEIAAPLRSILSAASNVTVLMGEAQKIDRVGKIVTTDFGSITYDKLIVACGCVDNFFGHDAWAAHATGLKSLEQATDIRRRVLRAFELAERETDAVRRRSLQSFVIIGGGPTGVELAGAIGEVSLRVLAEDFRNLDPLQTRIILLESGPRILPTFHESLSEGAKVDLQTFGVEVRTGAIASEISERGVVVQGQWIEASTVIWAAGVKPSALAVELKSSLDARGRVKVKPNLQLLDDADVYVLGDMASFEVQGGGTLPGLASVAMQQGQYLGKALQSHIKGNDIRPFVYLDKGQMATIGRKKAVVEVGKLRIRGIIAWHMWLFIHILYLIGFHNRFKVLLQWVWSYVTYKRPARLILDPAVPVKIIESKL